VKKPSRPAGVGRGAATTAQKEMPVTKAAAWHVTSQPPTMTATILQLMALVTTRASYRVA